MTLGGCGGECKRDFQLAAEMEFSASVRMACACMVLLKISSSARRSCEAALRPAATKITMSMSESGVLALEVLPEFENEKYLPFISQWLAHERKSLQQDSRHSSLLECQRATFADLVRADFSWRALISREAAYTGHPWPSTTENGTGLVLPLVIGSF